MMNNNNKVESLRNLILSDISVGIDLVNEINSWDGSLEHLQVISMDTFNELMHGVEPLEIANRIYFGNFNPNDEYFRFNGYGNLESLDEYDIKDEIINYSLEIAQRTVELYEDGHLSYLDDEVVEILEDQES